MDVRERGWGGMDWMHLAQYRDQWPASHGLEDCIEVNLIQIGRKDVNLIVHETKYSAQLIKRR